MIPMAKLICIFIVGSMCDRKSWKTDLAIAICMRSNNTALVIPRHSCQNSPPTLTCFQKWNSNLTQLHQKGHFCYASSPSFYVDIPRSDCVKMKIEHKKMCT